MLFRNFDKSPVTHSSGSIRKFVAANMMDTLTEFSDDLQLPMFMEPSISMIYFTKEGKPSPIFEEAAIKHKGKMTFIWSGVTKGLQERLASFMKVQEEVLPNIFIMDFSKKKLGPQVYRHAGDIKSASVDSIGEFIEGFKS